MNLMNKLTLKNLKLNQKRTIVTIIGIILSVALITALCSLYLSLIGSFINFEISERGNYHVVIYNVDKEDIDKYKNNKNIDNIYYAKDIGYSTINSKNDFKPYVFIKGITKKELNNFPIKLVSGKLPTNENEILIPTSLKTNGRVTYNVGDTITLNVGKRVTDEYELNQFNPYQENERIINSTEQQYKIVGIMERISKDVEPYDAPGYTFIKLIDEEETLDKVDVYIKYKQNVLKNFEEETYNLFDIDFELAKKCNDYDGQDELIECQEINQKMKYGIEANYYLIKLQTDPLGLETSGGLIIVVCIVCAIIIVTSVFCIKNSFDISITEKVKQYGMLKSIGATKKQIRKNVFYEATILGLIGIPLGILSGFLAAYILTLVCDYFIGDYITNNFKVVFIFSWFAVLASVLLGIFTIYLSAFKSATKASKTSPIDSIRNSSEIKINSKKIRCPKIITNIFGIGGEISYKNLKRNKKKYRTTIISIIVSVTVFISITAFMNMAIASSRNDFHENDYNIDIYFNSTEVTNNTINTIVNNETVKKYVLSKHSGLEMDYNRLNKEYRTLKYQDEELKDIVFYLNIQSLNKDIYLEYIKELGLNYEDIKDKGILYDTDKVSISKIEKGKEKTTYKFLRIYDYQKNDIITGKLFGEPDKKTNIKVGYVANTQPWGFTYNSGATLYVSEEYFDNNIEQDNEIIYFDSTNPSKLQDDIEKILGEGEYEIYNIEEETKLMRNFFTLLGIFFYGFIIVISLIGVTNIFNTITTNIELRKQEFAMLRSIGMTKKEFNNMIRLESIFMGTKSLIFGITFGIILSYIIHIYFNEQSGLPYIFPLNAIIISIIAVFLLITLIMNYSIKKIKKQNIIETIRNENI